MPFAEIDLSAAGRLSATLIVAPLYGTLHVQLTMLVKHTLQITLICQVSILPGMSVIFLQVGIFGQVERMLGIPFGCETEAHW